MSSKDVPFTEEEIRDAIQKVEEGDPQAVAFAKTCLTEAVLLADHRTTALMLKAFHAVGDYLEQEEEEAEFIIRNN